MNNRDIVNTIGFMIMILIIVIMYFFRYNSNIISKDITEIEWYRYNYRTGEYEKLLLKENEFKYYRPSNVNELSEYDICKNYTYDKKNNELNLDCNKSLRIISHDDRKLVISLNKEEKVFFKDFNESLNYEFETYYGKSMIEYKKDKSQVSELIEINQNKLLGEIKNSDYSKIVFIGDKCSSVDCILALDVLEKWIVKTKNVYFFNSNNMDKKLLLTLNKINSSFQNNIDFYNDIYPKVLITSNSKIIDKYSIKCRGFNCTKYYENEF